MSASAKSYIATPGRNVKAKSGWIRSILRQGCGLFAQILEYKLAWLGGDVLNVDPKYTSQTYPCSGNVAKDRRLTQAHFQCVDSGYRNNAHIVGALNILTRRHRVLAFGVNALATTLNRAPRSTHALEWLTRSGIFVRTNGGKLKT